jgi:hypothetical protein
MTHVLIRGDGVAARCCAHLLVRAGYSVSVQPASRPRLPAIMLSEPAQGLIGDIFERPGLFRHLPSIRQRIVAWAPGSGPVVLDHSAVVVSEEVLLDSLGPMPEAVDSTEAAWTVCASAPLPAAAAEHRFGSRFACTMPVELSNGAEPAACWIESLVDGWLFLIANAPGTGWLLAVGLQPESLLDQSAMIRSRVARVHAPTAQFAAAPRLVAPLGGRGWIACGTAAMAFDPLCGDGTAHAVREAILAAAVIQAAVRGEDVDALFSHYENRLTSAFQRHLTHCHQYYSQGRGGRWWQAEAGAAARGIEWCAGRLGADPKFRFRLNGLQLEAVS